jgi:nucleoside-diphosphate-sugar epimerase
MRVLITGANGRIGSVLCRTFLDRGHEVLAISRSNLSKHYFGERLISIVADLQNQIKLPYKIDVIVHAAAANPPASTLDYVRNNVVAATTVADIAVSSEVKSLIYLSSMSVYGRVSAHVVDELTEIISPDAYGLSKYQVEILFSGELKDVSVLSLRLPGVVGTNVFDRPWLQSVVHAAMRNESIVISNPFALFNNAIHVTALSEFIGEVAERGWDGCEVITLGAEKPISVISLVELILYRTKSKSKVIVNDGVKPFTIANSRAVEAFGYRPQAIADITNLITNLS